MALEKILNKLQNQIKEILPTIELFVDETIQPSVKDCEHLQLQLNALQENLTIYKYNKSGKEISPSFNIHAKVSEMEIKDTKASIEINRLEEKEVRKMNEPVIEKVIEKIVEPKPIVATETKQTNTHLKKLNIGLNDKFRFINELFKQNNTEYNVAYEQLNSLTTWYESELYLNSLKDVYEWKSTDDTVKYFFSISKKRFD